MTYSVSITPAAIRMLESMPRQIQARIRSRVDALSQNPRPPGCVKITGSECTYRIRIGDYRVLYEIHDNQRVVVVFIVAHRRESYRGL